jgi:hypothetical protein
MNAGTSQQCLPPEEYIAGSPMIMAVLLMVLKLWQVQA